MIARCFDAVTGASDFAGDNNRATSAAHNSRRTPPALQSSFAQLQRSNQCCSLIAGSFFTNCQLPVTSHLYA
jgi:hypothetical protein